MPSILDRETVGENFSMRSLNKDNLLLDRMEEISPRKGLNKSESIMYTKVKMCCCYIKKRKGKFDINQMKTREKWIRFFKRMSMAVSVINTLKHIKQNADVIYGSGGLNDPNHDQSPIQPLDSDIPPSCVHIYIQS